MTVVGLFSPRARWWRSAAGNRRATARSAGPCPRCGGRGSIPRWIFGFHAAAAAARDQASASENAAVYVAIRQSLATRRDATGGDVTAAAALPDALTGAWRGVAAVAVADTAAGVGRGAGHGVPHARAGRRALRRIRRPGRRRHHSQCRARKTRCRTIPNVSMSTIANG